MSLIDRLAGNEEPKLPTHQFYAALSEFAAGELTKAQIVDFFVLDSGEEAELDVLIAAYQAALPARKLEFRAMIHEIFLLAEVSAPGYTTASELNSRISRF